MAVYQIFLVCGIGILALFWIIRKKRKSNKISVIEAPKIVLLQVGTNAQQLLESDLNIYNEYYRTVSSTALKDVNELFQFVETASFDLFHVFVEISKDGYILDSFENKTTVATIANLMQSNGAKYIVFASNSPAQAYMNAGEYLTHNANIVMTIDRRGDNFTKFFKKIFEKVSKGVPFPEAWHEIQPQGRTTVNECLPETIAVMGADNVVLLGDK